ncbi:7948_t:CDS:1, partial [Gigaspora rosea]
ISEGICIVVVREVVLGEWRVVEVMVVKEVLVAEKMMIISEVVVGKGCQGGDGVRKVIVGEI